MNGPRVDNRTLRSARTRERLLDAAVAELDASRDLTIPAVARRAGTSVRTVYHHFSTKQDLFDGILARYTERFGMPLDASLEELPDVAGRRVRAYQEDPTLVRAMLHIDPQALARKRAEMVLPALAGIIAPLMSGRSADERRRLTAAIYAVHGLYTWNILHEYAGLSYEDTAKTIEWMTRTLITAMGDGVDGPAQE
jgi:AcrR family transcriptional regulator